MRIASDQTLSVDLSTHFNERRQLKQRARKWEKCRLAADSGRPIYWNKTNAITPNNSIHITSLTHPSPDVSNGWSAGMTIHGQDLPTHWNGWLTLCAVWLVSRFDLGLCNQRSSIWCSVGRFIRRVFVNKSFGDDHLCRKLHTEWWWIEDRDNSKIKQEILNIRGVLKQPLDDTSVKMAIRMARCEISSLNTK